MASPSRDPEASEIRRRGRQRLIGAVVLVLLLVVFVPMLLDSEPKAPRSSPNLDIPAKDTAPALPPAKEPAKAATPAATPAPAVTPAPAATAAPAVTPAQAGAQSSKPPEAAKVEPVPVEPKAAAAPSTPPPKPAPGAATPVLKGFVVQVGAFRDEAKLQQAQAKLKSAGVVHYTERLDGKNGPLTRLRAGPFATREQAEAAQVAIKRAALDGKVIPLP